MANPRQRRKLKSGTYKPVQTTKAKNLRKVPMIRAPQPIRDAWNKHKSLNHNYAALGLSRTAGRSLKGEKAPIWPVRRPSTAFSTSTSSKPPLPPPTSSTEPNVSSSSTDLPKGYGRIIRDADGNVLRVEMAEVASAPEEQPWTREPLNPFQDEDEWNGLAEAPPKNDVILALEERASMWGKPPRPTSILEIKWLVSLVKAHGDDLKAMHMDMKRNVWQRTPGELKRSIKKAGGIDYLRSLFDKEEFAGVS